MSKLLAYLNLLDKDSAAGAAHAQDPNAAMAGFGLSDAEQAALRSGDSAEVAKLAGVDASAMPPPQYPQDPYNG